MHALAEAAAYYFFFYVIDWFTCRGKQLRAPDCRLLTLADTIHNLQGACSHLLTQLRLQRCCQLQRQWPCMHIIAPCSSQQRAHGRRPDNRDVQACMRLGDAVHDGCWGQALPWYGTACQYLPYTHAQGEDILQAREQDHAEQRVSVLLCHRPERATPPCGHAHACC